MDGCPHRRCEISVLDIYRGRKLLIASSAAIQMILYEKINHSAVFLRIESNACTFFIFGRRAAMELCANFGARNVI
jgi:hypothetical protein